MNENQTTRKQKPTGRRVQIIAVAVLVALLAVALSALWIVTARQRTPRSGPAQSPAWLIRLQWILIGLAVLVFVRLTGRAVREWALSTWDELYSRWMVWRHDQVMLEAAEQQNKLSTVRHFEPTATGRLGVTMDVNGNYRDMDTMRVYNQLETVYLNPILEGIGAIRGYLEAAGGWPPSPATAEAMLPKPVVSELPRMVPLSGLLAGHAPSYQRVVLGVAQDEAGHQQEVVAPMVDFSHIGVGGTSGWGKSVFLRSLAYQFAKSAEAVDLVLIDLEGVTFSPFAECDRLLWPIADTTEDAVTILQKLTEEIDRRKALFAQYPGVDSLARYNEVASEKLDPIVCLIDEATALLSNKQIEALLKVLSLRARKYGIWCVLAGQDWKATSLDSAIKNQLATRVQFKTMSGPQSRVLLESAGAEDIDVKGRALAWIPGHDRVTLQAPYIGYGQILKAMAGGHGPQADIPQEDQEDQDRIIDLARQGLSMTKIAEIVYGSRGGAAFYKVKEVLGGATTVVDPLE